MDLIDILALAAVAIPEPISSAAGEKVLAGKTAAKAGTMAAKQGAKAAAKKTAKERARKMLVNKAKDIIPVANPMNLPGHNWPSK